MLLLLGVILLGIAAYVAAEAATLAARQRRDVVERAATYGALPDNRRGARRPGSDGRLWAPFVEWVADVTLRLMPRTSRADVTDRLLRAGVANRIGADGFLGTKVLFAFLGVVLGLVIGSALGVAVGIVLAVAMGMVAWVLPDLFLNSRFRQRQDRVSAALPDALDLLAVTVEAGLGFDAALARLIDSTDGPLSEEFALTLNEMRIGESRIDALKRMAGRVDVRELNSFVRAVVQADQLGMSMGAMLRIQAADVRVRRQLAAEETAMKMPIKMVFPMVFFILPAMFIVILAPFFLDFNGVFGS
jgi:tight adherence protein C